MPFDEAFSFERQHHLTDRRRADAKILLHNGAGGMASEAVRREREEEWR